MEKIQKDYGSIVLKDGKIWNYEGGFTGQGYVYKDYDAYSKGEGICYISEYGLEDLRQELTALDKYYKENPQASEEDYLSDRQFILASNGYTKEDFLDLTGNEETAFQVFTAVDWQYPETYFNELEENED